MRVFVIIAFALLVLVSMLCGLRGTCDAAARNCVGNVCPTVSL